MKSLICFSLMAAFALTALAGENQNVSFKVHESELNELEKDGTVEVIPVRPRREKESEKGYSDYLYGVAGLDTHLAPVAGFIGIGVKDAKGVIAGEARIKANILGVYGGERNNAIGAGVQVYAYPFRLSEKNSKLLSGIYISAGHERYVSFGDKSSSLKSNTSYELGYEFSESLRLGIGRDSMEFSNEDLDVYLIKISMKFGKKRK